MNIFNKKISYLILFFILLMTLQSCIKKQEVKIKKEETWNYVIGIEGIECKICAFKMLKALEKIENISDVQIICSSDFKECNANFKWHEINKNIDINLIDQIIQNEGFKLKKISGNFIGIFKENDKFQLDLNGFNNIDFIQSEESNCIFTINQKVTIAGNLFFKNGKIWLTM